MPGTSIDGRLALDLVSTDRGGRDGLESAARLTSWLAERETLLGLAGPEVGLRLADFRALREDVRALFLGSIAGAPLPTEATRRVNETSAAVPMHLRLDPTDPPTAVLTGGGGSRTSEALAAIARSAIGIVGGPDRTRLRRCPAPRCGRFFLASRAGRVWCTAACGNRARVARHLARARRP